jgi:hypothetical protein
VLLVTFINSAVRNTHRLYRLEPLPATSGRGTTIHRRREADAEL